MTSLINKMLGSQGSVEGDFNEGDEIWGEGLLIVFSVIEIACVIVWAFYAAVCGLQKILINLIAIGDYQDGVLVSMLSFVGTIKTKLDPLSLPLHLLEFLSHVTAGCGTTALLRIIGKGLQLLGKAMNVIYRRKESKRTNRNQGQLGEDILQDNFFA